MRRLPSPVLCALVLLSMAVVPLGSASETLTAEYDVGSSIVIRDVFGFGVLACARDDIPDAAKEQVHNGPCLQYGGLEGSTYNAAIHDEQFDSTGFTAAVDINGDGCVSTSCQGVPNDRDYRVSGCTSISGVLPETEEGVVPFLQFFIRVVDLDADDLETCFATSGQVTVAVS